MTLAEFQKLVARTTYKKGFSLKLEPGKIPDTGMLTLTVRVEDVGGKGMIELYMINVISQDQLEPLGEKEAVEFYIARLFWDWERHEMEEWLKVDGRTVFDPDKAHAKAAV